MHLYDDRITIVYNTSLNPTEEIYNKPDNDPNNNDNNGGTTIYKTELNFENEQEKSRPNSDEFKRLLNGGEGGKLLPLIYCGLFNYQDTICSGFLFLVTI